MKVNQRFFAVQKAHVDMADAVLKVTTAHPDLTTAEITSILAHILLEWNRYTIREERAQ